MKIPIDPLKFTPFISWLFKLWAKTLRFEMIGDSHSFLRQGGDGQPVVVALWHGELFPITAVGCAIDVQFAALVSQSKDGEFIARVLESLGHETMRGSSSRGGVKALIQAVRGMANTTRVVAFTMDGPRGPRHKAKDGIIFLAKHAGVKIIPLRAYPKNKKVFEKSWDRFVLPLPFTRCPVYFGEPLEVEAGTLNKENIKRERERLEKAMQALGPHT